MMTLLFKPDQILLPFLRQVMQRGLEASFHTPNALNARFITKDIARCMVQAGFRTFYLGFESSAYTWQRHPAGKSMPMNWSGPWSTSSVLGRISARSRRI